MTELKIDNKVELIKLWLVIKSRDERYLDDVAPPLTPSANRIWGPFN